MGNAAIQLRHIELAPGDAVAAVEDPCVAMVPAMALALRRVVSNPNASVREMVELIASDPILLGRLLGTAHRHGVRDVFSIQTAARALGAAGLAQLLVKAVTDGYVIRTRHYGACLGSLRRHARATGHLAHLIAGYTGADGRAAFLAGTLHEIGFAGGLVHVGVESDVGPPALADVWPQLGEVRREAHNTLFERWGLHPAIGHAIHALHVDAPAPNPLATTLRLADLLARICGKGVVSPWREERPEQSSFVYAAAAAGVDGLHARRLLDEGRWRVSDIK